MSGEPDNRIVVVLNKSFELGQMVSAIGHVCAGLGAIVGPEEMSLVTYVDANGLQYPSISDWPVLILRGRGGQIKTTRQDLKQAGLPVVCYTDTMFSGGSEAQQAATQQISTDALVIVAMATIGPRSVLEPLTKRFSLWQ